VVVELKTVEAVLPVHRSRYLLNFHVAQMRDGIVRMANGL